MTPAPTPMQDCTRGESDPETQTRGGFFLRAWPFGLFCLLTTILFLPLLMSPSDMLMATPDIECYFQWLHQYAHDEFRAGRIPLWNPCNYAGTPFAANPQCSVFYPLSWWYLVLPVIQAHKWMIATHSLLAGCFMYLCARQMARSRAAATAASLPWMFGSYFMANAAVGHLPMLFTMTWLPLVIYFYDRFLERPRPALLFWTGFVLGVQLLAGEPQNSYYTILLMSVYGLVHGTNVGPSALSWRQPRRYGRWVIGLLGIGIVAASSSAIQLLPTAEFAAQSDRSHNTYDFITNFSYPPTSALGFLIPWSTQVRQLGNTAGHAPLIELNWQFAGYVGIFTLVLAMASFGIRSDSKLRAIRAAAVMAIVLMLGANTPFFAWLLKCLPGLQFFRGPARSIVILVWALCIMSALGWDCLFSTPMESAKRAWWRRVALVLLILAEISLFAWVGLAGTVKFTQAGAWWQVTSEPLLMEDPVIIKPLAVILGSLLLLLVLPWLRKRTAQVAILSCIAIDLLVAKPTLPLRHFSPANDYSLKTMAELRDRSVPREQRPFRVDLASYSLDVNAALVARLDNINAYWPVALRRFYRFVHFMRDNPARFKDRHELHDDLYETDRLFALRLLNVRYATRIRHENWMTFVDIVEEPHPLPRAWLVKEREVIQAEEATLARMRHTNFDPATRVILERAPRKGIPLASAGVESTPVSCITTERPGGALDIETNSSTGGHLVISTIFYPGWRASVDGQEVPLERADYLISALPLPPGRHHIRCWYEPLSFKVGVTCTVVASIVAGILLLRAAVKRASRATLPSRQV